MEPAWRLEILVSLPLNGHSNPEGESNTSTLKWLQKETGSQGKTAAYAPPSHPQDSIWGLQHYFAPVRHAGLHTTKHITVIKHGRWKSMNQYSKVILWFVMDPEISNYLSKREEEKQVQ